MWIGTSDGVYRFDGYEYKVYRNDPNDSTTLHKNSILRIYEDSEGILWISSNNGGLHTYNRDHDNFIRIEAYSYDCEVGQIIEDDNKNLWIGGIKWPHAFTARLDRESHEWEYFEIIPSKNPVISILPASDNTFWLGINNTGFFKWNVKDNSLHRYLADKSNPNSIVSNVFRKAIKDAFGNIWIATQDGLSKFEIATGNFINYSAHHGSDKSFLLVNNILDLCLDENYIWIGTENGGLSQLNTRTNTLKTFLHSREDPTSLVDNSVKAIYKDQQERIWVGTFSKGLCVYDKMKYKFSELNVPLENNIVNAIWQDSKNRLWIGTEGGVAMKDKDEVKYFRHFGPQVKFNSDPVLSIYEDSRQQMWFGTWANGVSRYEEDDRSFTNFLPVENGVNSLSNPNVFSILEESQNHRMLFGTYGGINVYDERSDNPFRTYTSSDEFEFNNYIRTIFEDSQGNIWMGTIQELIWFDPDGGKITRFNEGINIGSSRVNGLVYCIVEDKKNRIWVGTTEGLHMIINKKLVKRYTTKHGLPNNTVNGILEDEKGNLWLSTNEGIVKLNPDANSYKIYDVSDGLLSNNFRPNAFFKNKEGWFFFGSEGVNVFHPDSITENTHIPEVYITDLKVFNKSVEIGDGSEILNKHITETNEITLHNQYNFFSINYVALNYTSTNKNQYAYMLESFDQDWNYVNDQRTATFTNLDAGTYIFRVKASNNDDLWNEHGAILTIHILPSWWQTWWAQLIGILLLISFAVTFYKVRISTIKKQNKRLEKLVGDRTMALQESQQTIKEQNDEIRKKNEWLEKEVNKRTKSLVERSQQLERFTFIAAHNLRAPIARVLGLGRLMGLINNNNINETKEIADRLVDATEECDQVVKDLSLILDIQRDHTSVITRLDIRDVMKWIKKHLEKEIRETNTQIEEQFSACTHVNSVKTYFESILMNLISNAIKYRHPNRTPVIKVSAANSGEHILVSVSDNGVGMDLSVVRDKLFTLYSQFHEHTKGKGMGLYLVKTQVVTLDGYIEVKSEMGKGTTFDVFLKRE